MALKYSSRWLLLLLMQVFFPAECQNNRECTEFLSPLKLVTDESIPGSIFVPYSLASGAEYRPNQNCEWRIHTDDEERVIKLQVEQCQLEGVDLGGECNHDYVDVFDVIENTQSFMGRFCGTRDCIGKIYTSSSQDMIVRFHSNSLYEFSGFSAKYQASEKESDDDGYTPVVALAVGIPVGVAVLAMVISFSYAMFKIYKQRKPPRRRALDSIPREGRIVEQVTTFRPPRETFPRDLQIHISDEYDPGNVPLQFIPPSYTVEDPQRVRSATPPPSYDSLGYDAVRPGRGEEPPLTPPSYEQVVKEGVEV